MGGANRTHLAGIHQACSAGYRRQNRHVLRPGFKIEAYIFIAAIYFTCCFAMSRYSLWIERRLAVSKAR